MASTIQVRRSSVAGKVPTTSQLAPSELAMNTHDGRLFWKKDDGAAQEIIEAAPTKAPKFSEVAEFEGLRETAVTLSGTAPSLSVSQGTIFLHTLSGNTTYSDGLSDGESLTLMIDDGSAFTVTWPSVTWKTDGGDPPALNETGLTAIVLWKIDAVLYGARVGDN